MEAEELVNTLADRLAEVKVETLGYTLGLVDCKAVVDPLAYTLGEVEVEKFANSLGDMKAYTLVDVLGYTLAGKKGKDIVTRSEVEAEALADTLTG